MPTEFLTPAEVLEFRDKAFVTYHSNPTFLARIQGKFGDKAVNNINKMLQITLKRKIIEDKSSKLGWAYSEDYKDLQFGWIQGQGNFLHTKN